MHGQARQHLARARLNVSFTNHSTDLVAAVEVAVAMGAAASIVDAAAVVVTNGLSCLK